MLNTKKAGGGTNFVCVFDFIMKYVKNKKKYNTKNLTVIFFTDGCDTTNKQDKIDKSLEDLKICVQQQEVNARFLTIGFSREHDPVFLNRIAQSGSEMGNFSSSTPRTQGTRKRFLTAYLCRWGWLLCGKTPFL